MERRSWSDGAKLHILLSAEVVLSLFHFGLCFMLEHLSVLFWSMFHVGTSICFILVSCMNLICVVYETDVLLLV